MKKHITAKIKLGLELSQKEMYFLNSVLGVSLNQFKLDM